MVSDSLAVSNHDRIFGGAVKKLFKLGDHTVIGVSGNAGFDQAAKEALADAAEDVNRAVPVLADWIGSHFHEEFGYTVLLVNKKRELFEIDSLGAILPVDLDYWCIGSGGEVAQAFLTGRWATAPNYKIASLDGELAVKYTASALTSVDNRCQTVSLYA
jgi:20S proteasome alpha/beta subunit